MALEAPRRQSPPEFLLKLSKILQTEDQSIIAWENGELLLQQQGKISAAGRDCRTRSTLNICVFLAQAISA
jgi:hypothetical protein